MITGLIWATLLPPTIGPHIVCRDPHRAIIATHGPALAEWVHAIADRRPAVPAWGHIWAKSVCYVGTTSSADCFSSRTDGFLELGEQIRGFWQNIGGSSPRSPPPPLKKTFEPLKKKNSSVFALNTNCSAFTFAAILLVSSRLDFIHCTCKLSRQWRQRRSRSFTSNKAVSDRFMKLR